jgi:hypothetical protein
MLSDVTTFEERDSMAQTRKTRPVSWIKAALRDFEAFPGSAQSPLLTALTIAAEGGKVDIAKPMHGLGSGVFEIALAFRVTPFELYTLCNSRTIFGSSTRFRRNRNRASRRRNTKSTW